MGLAFHKDPKSVLSSGVKAGGIEVHYGDQSKKETMDDLVRKGPWDIIIDDGSHFPDLETSYWDLPYANIYSYDLKHTGIGAKSEYSTVTKLQEIEQVLVRHQIGANELSVMPGDHTICSIEWGMNLVKIQKCGSDDGVGPDYLPQMYDRNRMERWISNAQSTNPMKDSNGNFVPFD
eukprot:4242076-Ditylum_brightwellii.AAC.1